MGQDGMNTRERTLIACGTAGDFAGSGRILQRVLQREKLEQATDVAVTVATACTTCYRAKHILTVCHSFTCWLVGALNLQDAYQAMPLLLLQGPSVPHVRAERVRDYEILSAAAHPLRADPQRMVRDHRVVMARGLY
jgi:hypothetical protein